MGSTTIAYGTTTYSPYTGPWNRGRLRVYTPVPIPSGNQSSSGTYPVVAGSFSYAGTASGPSITYGYQYSTTASSNYIYIEYDSSGTLYFQRTNNGYTVYDGADGTYWTAGQGLWGTYSWSTVPAQMSKPTATASSSSGQINLTWSAPDNGGSSITGYKIDAYSGGVYKSSITTGAVTSGSFTGLTPGVSYTFRIAAINGVGTAIASADSTAVVAPGSLGGPKSVTITTNSSATRSVIIAWQKPDNPNSISISGYKIYYKTSSNGTRTLLASISGENTLTYTSNSTTLNANTLYYFDMTTVTAFGEGGYSSVASGYTSGPPSAPTNVSLTSVGVPNGSLKFSFEAPTSNGNPGGSLTYKVYYYKTSVPGTIYTVSSAVSPLVISNLAPGTNYSFYATATSSGLPGVESPASTTVTTYPVSELQWVDGYFNDQIVIGVSYSDYAYAAGVSGTPASTDVTYALSSGSLPPGISINASDTTTLPGQKIIRLSGTATTPGIYPITISASAAGVQSINTSATLNVAGYGKRVSSVSPQTVVRIQSAKRKTENSWISIRTAKVLRNIFSVSRSSSGTTRTITTSAAHGLSIGDMVYVSGFSGTSASDYNSSSIPGTDDSIKTFTVTAIPTSTQFSYTGVTSLTQSSTSDLGGKFWVVVKS